MCSSFRLHCKIITAMAGTGGRILDCLELGRKVIFASPCSRRVASRSRLVGRAARLYVYNASSKRHAAGSKEAKTVYTSECADSDRCAAVLDLPSHTCSSLIRRYPCAMRTLKDNCCHPNNEGLVPVQVLIFPRMCYCSSSSN